MGESDISIGLILFLLCEFFVGCIVGVSVAKDRDSGHRGMAVAIALGLAVFIYSTVLWTVATQRFHGPIHALIGILGAVFGTLSFGFCFWLISVLVATVGYTFAFSASKRLGIGSNRITIANILAFLSVLAALAALAQASRQ